MTKDDKKPANKISESRKQKKVAGTHRVPPVKTHKQVFEQLLDDAVLGVKKK